MALGDGYVYVNIIPMVLIVMFVNHFIMMLHGGVLLSKMLTNVNVSILAIIKLSI